MDAENRCATVVYRWRQTGEHDTRSTEQLIFSKENGELRIHSNEMALLSSARDAHMGDVHSLERFQTLYANDLGLPDPGTMRIDEGDPLHAETLQDPAQAAVFWFDLTGGTVVHTDDYYAGNKLAGAVVTYQFADGATVCLVILDHYGVAYLPQDWFLEDGSNSRTAADLAQQWARGMEHETAQYRYAILSVGEQRKFLETKQQEGNDGEWYWKIGGSSPSVRRWSVVAEQDSAHIVYAAWDSTPREYRYDETLRFENDEHGRLTVVDTSQGYDYVPDYPEIDSLDIFLKLYDNALGMPDYTPDQIEALRNQNRHQSSMETARQILLLQSAQIIQSNALPNGGLNLTYRFEKDELGGKVLTIAFLPAPANSGATHVLLPAGWKTEDGIAGGTLAPPRSIK